jgi:hypothetical protein
MFRMRIHIILTFFILSLIQFLTADSIDYNDPKSSASRAIDVVLDGVIQVPSLAALYESYIPKLNSFVSEQKRFHGDTSEPTLDWVFLRKYEGSYYDSINEYN